MTGVAIDTAAAGRAACALAGLLLLLVAALWLFRRHGGGLQPLRPGSRLAVTASLALDARVRLVLVRRDDMEHLLALAPGGVSVLESRPTPAATATVTGR